MLILDCNKKLKFPGMVILVPQSTSIDFKGFFASRVRKFKKMAVFVAGFIRFAHPKGPPMALPTLTLRPNPSGLIHPPLPPIKNAAIYATFSYWSEWMRNLRTQINLFSFVFFLKKLFSQSYTRFSFFRSKCHYFFCR